MSKDKIMIDEETQLPFRAVKVHPDPGLRFGGLLECARRTSSYLKGFGTEGRWTKDGKRKYDAARERLEVIQETLKRLNGGMEFSD